MSSPLNDLRLGLEIGGVAFPPAGGEVVDDDDVVVLCERVCKVRADEAGTAGDDVAHEEFMAVGRFRGF